LTEKLVVQRDGIYLLGDDDFHTQQLPILEALASKNGTQVELADYTPQYSNNSGWRISRALFHSDP
jgi:hypothetical protein